MKNYLQTYKKEGRKKQSKIVLFKIYSLRVRKPHEYDGLYIKGVMKGNVRQTTFAFP